MALIIIKTNEISSLFRYILIIPTYIITSYFISSFLPFLVKFLSFFWNVSDTAFNVYFYGAILLPFANGYLPIAAASFVSPNYRLVLASIISTLQIILVIFVIYLSTILFDQSDYETFEFFAFFDLDVDNKIVFYLRQTFYFIGTVFAVWAEKNEMSIFDN